MLFKRLDESVSLRIPGWTLQWKGESTCITQGWPFGSSKWRHFSGVRILRVDQFMTRYDPYCFPRSTCFWKNSWMKMVLPFGGFFFGSWNILRTWIHANVAPTSIWRPLFATTDLPRFLVVLVLRMSPEFGIYVFGYGSHDPSNDPPSTWLPGFAHGKAKPQGVIRVNLFHLKRKTPSGFPSGWLYGDCFLHNQSKKVIKRPTVISHFG